MLCVYCESSYVYKYLYLYCVTSEKKLYDDNILKMEKVFYFTEKIKKD
jgi:hypothetical protein